MRTGRLLLQYSLSAHSLWQHLRLLSTPRWRPLLHPAGAAEIGPQRRVSLGPPPPQARLTPHPESRGRAAEPKRASSAQKASSRTRTSPSRRGGVPQESMPLGPSPYANLAARGTHSKAQGTPPKAPGRHPGQLPRAKQPSVTKGGQSPFNVWAQQAKRWPHGPPPAGGQR